MAEPNTVSKIKNDNMTFFMEGKLTKLTRSQNQTTFVHEIIVAGKDAFSKPSEFIVLADAPIGEVESIVSGRVELEGFIRRFDTTNKATGVVTKNGGSEGKTFLRWIG